MAVPLVYGNTQFGVLGLHSTRTNAFGRDEREIIEQLGEVVGYVFYAIERKEMLDSALELTFRSEKLADPFAHHGDEDIELTLETVVPLDTDENRFIEYWHVNDDFVDSFRDAVDQHDPKLDVRLLSTVDGLARCEVSAGAKSMSSVFASQGGKLRTASIDDNAVEIVGEFPDDVDPEQVTSGLRDAFPDIELVSQQRILTPQYLRQIVDENLTEKQRRHCNSRISAVTSNSRARAPAKSWQTISVLQNKHFTTTCETPKKRCSKSSSKSPRTPHLTSQTGILFNNLD